MSGKIMGDEAWGAWHERGTSRRGRHVPRLSFLSVLLSDEEALTPAEDCYHRLLTPGERDEMELVESYLKTNSLTALYDSVFIPVLTAAENDARADIGSLCLLDTKPRQFTDREKRLLEEYAAKVTEEIARRAAASAAG